MAPNFSISLPLSPSRRITHNKREYLCELFQGCSLATIMLQFQIPDTLVEEKVKLENRPIVYNAVQLSVCVKTQQPEVVRRYLEMNQSNINY